MFWRANSDRAPCKCEDIVGREAAAIDGIRGRWHKGSLAQAHAIFDKCRDSNWLIIAIEAADSDVRRGRSGNTSGAKAQDMLARSWLFNAERRAMDAEDIASSKGE